MRWKIGPGGKHAPAAINHQIPRRALAPVNYQLSTLRHSLVGLKVRWWCIRRRAVDAAILNISSADTQYGPSLHFNNNLRLHSSAADAGHAARHQRGEAICTYRNWTDMAWWNIRHRAVGVVGWLVAWLLCPAPYHYQPVSHPTATHQLLLPLSVCV